MPTISELRALEILDSRGRPTLLATCALASGVTATASVPSGASTGTAEALELRDRDPRRYRGLGCLTAARHVSEDIQRALRGKSFASQAALDEALIALDGTPNKSRLGANAILAVSLAFARAHAAERGVPLYRHFGEMAGAPASRLPRPMINLFSGGKHAGGQTAIQDVLIIPTATTMGQVLADAYAVYQAAAELTQRKYNARPLKADEGGLAPPFVDEEAMLQDALEAIRLAGLEPGRDIALAVDVASSHFFEKGVYGMGRERLSGEGMVEKLIRWTEAYPLLSIEDGLAEEDWPHWARLRQKLAGRALTLGDDLLCTNPGRIRAAIASGAADALLLKVNQIGTLTEALEASALARAAGWQVVVSARSGETEDNWLADLAVGWAGDYIKIGSITQSERLAKYNRLLVIEEETGWRVGTPGKRM
ncbi:MAG TPA: enolase C-terminal domain-like protein [Thermoflexales bacterium]|nr:enolase C-terminal domain-like protein [Thermoflexales bacterium]HQX10069.1 enolase C-terminal domain-like protein [Thermoflexales bacterium]HRA54037.1 enolase C-terminal domain-like protein [Thermoflexales bacterium]